MRIKKGIKVRIESTKHFTSQEQAREYAIKVLQTGVTYLTIDDWYEEVEDPAEPEPEPPKIDHRKYPHHVRKKPRTKSPAIFPLEMEGFVRNNLDFSNKELAKRINIQFDLDMDNKNISDYMRTRKIKRGQKEKPGPLKKFTPEVDKYILDNAPEMSDKDIAKSLKRVFGIDTTPGSVGNRKSVIGNIKFKKKEQTAVDMRKISKYPDEMKEFIESRMETTTNQDLCDLLNKKWNLGLIKERLKSYMKYNQLKRINIIRSPRRTNVEIGKKVGKPKIYTDEVLQFLKDNINNFKNKELCEELESRFNIKIPQSSLQNTLSKKGIKRDIQPDVEPEIEDFILQSKTKSVYLLKDEIIEKLGKNIPTRKIMNIMGKRKEDLPGESVKEEVDRIEAKRARQQSDPFDEDVDDLDLDN